MKKKYVGFAILLILIIAMPVSYFIALKVVGDAVGSIGFGSESGSVNVEQANATLSGIFLLENRADIPLTFDVNIKVFVRPSDNQPFNGDLEFLFGTSFDNMQFIGNVSTENALAPPYGQAEVPGSFVITSEDTLKVIRSGNFIVLWVTYELKVTGSFLGWRITRVPTFL